MIEYLNWDSRFFGQKIGQMDIDPSNPPEAYLFLEAAQKFDLVYVNSPSVLLPNDVVLGMNLDLMDIMLTMSMPLQQGSKSHKENDLQTTLTSEELQQCYRISEQISEASRFTREPLIGPEKTKSLYRAWIDNTLDKSFADGIFLYKNNGIIRGFLIIKTIEKQKVGRCSLIGLDKDLQKTGGGTTLWKMALSHWAAQSNINKTIVSFSLMNEPSFKFHLKIGFNQVEEVKYIYHYRNRLI